MVSPTKISFQQALMLAFTVAALFLLVAVAICLAENERTTKSKDVADQPFAFVGSYVPIEKTGEILALGQEESGQLFWQFYNGDENLRGSVEKTEDPNLYLLLMVIKLRLD